jgi:hypothetical protein
MKTGIELIATERQEQIEKHSRDINSDVLGNSHLEIRDAVMELITDYPAIEMFPYSWQGKIMIHAIQKSYKERLIIAGALIAAEIDRLQAIE